MGRLAWRAFLIAWSFACAASAAVSLFHQEYAYGAVTGSCAMWIGHLQAEFRWGSQSVEAQQRCDQGSVVRLPPWR